MVGFQHRAHREILHLRVREIRAEDHREGLAALDLRTQLHRHLPRNATDQCVDFRVAVRIGRDRSGNADPFRRRRGLHRLELYPRPLDRLSREGYLHNLIRLDCGG